MKLNFQWSNLRNLDLSKGNRYSVLLKAALRRSKTALKKQQTNPKCQNPLSFYSP